MRPIELQSIVFILRRKQGFTRLAGTSRVPDNVRGDSPVTAIDLTADLFFVSAVRAAADSSFTRLLPLADLREPLAPHPRFAQRMLLGLQSVGYIQPELSLSWAADWLSSRDWFSYGFENVSWRIVRSPLESTDALHNWAEGTDPATSIFEMWLRMWEDLALAEVAQYARWSLGQVGFNPSWANEATGALTAGLQKFSIEQVMYLVHIALRSLALHHQRSSTGVGRLGHVFSNSIHNYVQRAQSERWTIRGMVRTPDLPRSAIATLFADSVTGLGDRYYTDRPSLDALARALVDGHTLH